MTDIMIPAGMTEEYYEIHASQEEFDRYGTSRELPQYEKPGVTVDMVATAFEGKIKLFVIRRKAHPYQNCFGSSWRFYGQGEDAAHACQHEE